MHFVAQDERSKDFTCVACQIALVLPEFNSTEWVKNETELKIKFTDRGKKQWELPIVIVYILPH